MLITFRCKAYANVMMFGDVALHMLQLMGVSQTVPSSISPTEAATALSNLKAAIEQEKARAQDEDKQDEDNDDEWAPTPVSLSSRAIPLIELLSAAVADDCDVMWDSN
ncbi:DUF1840 domain-containing protein [Vibrio mytili]|uniref:DUF1840 domain-containing protein n=1 Tax=Vibrio mytili TaxID=50718 RepID=UPI0039E7E112